MKKIATLALLFVPISFFGGCSSASITSISNPEVSTASTLVIYRPDTWAAKWNDMIVAIDGDEIVTLHNRQFVPVLVSPGSHELSVRGKAGFKASLAVTAKPSEKLYFEAAGSSNNSMNFIPGSVLLKENFYIKESEPLDLSGFNAASVNYK